MDDPIIFDRHAVRLHRDRAAATTHNVATIYEEAADRLLDRLDDTTHSFARALDIGGRGVVAPRLAARGIQTISCDISPAMAGINPGLRVCADEEWLPFGPGSFDLVVANLSLHWVNDLPGTLTQIRHALKPDGLFLACIPILPTLAPLCHALSHAEASLRGGVAPRISPFTELQDCAALLQRVGFALPVADADEISLTYRTGMGLLRDLRAAGETNAVMLRERSSPSPALFAIAMASLQEADAPFEIPLRIAIMTGWAPAKSQPKALKPGQFSVSLEDALRDAPEEF